MRGRIVTIAVAGAVACAGVAVLVFSLTQRGSAPDRRDHPAGIGAEVAFDPVPWTRVEFRLLERPFAVGDPEPVRVDGVAASSDLLVGWGRVGAAGRNQFHEMGAVFASADGFRWRAISLDDGVPAADTSEPRGVAAGPGGLLAWGGVCCGIEQPAMWRSADGFSWARMDLAGGVDDPGVWITDVIGIPNGWLAVGTDGDEAAMWTSPDGAAWRAVDAKAAGLGRGSISDVASTKGGFLAVGTIDDAAATHDGGVWTSDDGLSWSRIAMAEPTFTGPDETELGRIVPFASGVFVVGNHGPHEERVQCEQLLGGVARADGPVAPETALSCGWGREHHWLSADGSAWRRLPPFDPLPGQPVQPGARPIEFRHVVAGGLGLVVLGEDNVPPDTDSALWVSPDGIQWHPITVTGDRPMSGEPAGVVVKGRTIIVVGGELGGGSGVVIRIGAAH